MSKIVIHNQANVPNKLLFLILSSYMHDGKSLIRASFSDKQYKITQPRVDMDITTFVVKEVFENEN